MVPFKKPYTGLKSRAHLFEKTQVDTNVCRQGQTLGLRVFRGCVVVAGTEVRAAIAMTSIGVTRPSVLN